MQSVITELLKRQKAVFELLKMLVKGAEGTG